MTDSVEKPSIDRTKYLIQIRKQEALDSRELAEDNKLEATEHKRLYKKEHTLYKHHLNRAKNKDKEVLKLKKKLHILEQKATKK